MFVPDHIVQYIANPSDRRLILVDADTGGFATQIALPKKVGQIVWFDKKMYDYWGREVKIDPTIKRLVCSMGSGQCFFLAERTPVFLVENKDGTYAFAGVAYVERDNQHLCSFDDPNSFPLTSDVIIGAKVTCSKWNGFSAVDRDFFKGTPIGEVLRRIGCEFWAAKYADRDEIVIVGNPYRHIDFEVKFNLFDEKSEYRGGCIELINARLEERGRKLVGQMKAYNVNREISNRLLIVELSANWLERKYHDHLDKENDDWFMLDPIPFRLVLDNPCHY